MITGAASPQRIREYNEKSTAYNEKVTAHNEKSTLYNGKKPCKKMAPRITTYLRVIKKAPRIMNQPPHIVRKTPRMMKILSSRMQ